MTPVTTSGRAGVGGDVGWRIQLVRSLLAFASLSAPEQGPQTAAFGRMRISE